MTQADFQERDRVLQQYLGKTVTVVIDRPMGYKNPKYPDMVYPINYGYIEGVIAADGEEQDMYVLGVDEPVSTYTGVVIAAIRRLDDVEDKWVVAPEGIPYSDMEIAYAVDFTERYYDSTVYMNIAR